MDGVPTSVSRVLVTGGAGFVGAAVVAALLEDGHEVRVLDTLDPDLHPRGWPDHLDPRAERVVGDVRDLPTGVLDGVDVVSHQAAVVGLGVDLQDLPHYVSNNDLGTASLLAGMGRAGVGRLVLASSMVVYGEGRYACVEHGRVTPAPRREADLAARKFEPPCPACGSALSWEPVPEDAPLDPRSTYAATKVAQEHLAASWARLSGGRAAALRYHNVYGPWMPKDTPYAGVASLWRSALARGERPRVFEDGGQQRDFVHVTDVARANALALDAGEPGALTAVNVASGHPVTVLDVATALSASSGLAPVVTGEYRLGDVRHVVAAPDKAREVLGFTAAITPERGLAAFGSSPLRGDPAPGTA
ncbi:MAG: NAD-dependent epimerase/dehydratase family protein [Actinomycetota bacterium]|nr:NAD-dependent epimerase/dehydratase family protein [Actinomycetota bacterium]